MEVWSNRILYQSYNNLPVYSEKGAIDHTSCSQSEKKPQSHFFQDMETLYQDLGVKAFSALSNCLDWLGNINARSKSAISTEQLRTVMEKLQEELKLTVSSCVNEFKEYIDSRFNTIEAGVRRIDRFTLDAYRELEELKREKEEPVAQSGEDTLAPVGRLAREEAIELALKAGKRMRKEGKMLSLAAVAREAGLKYGQIVYAFGNKDAFFSRLKKEIAVEERESIDEQAV